MFDLIIKNGEIIDGSGSGAYMGDIAVSNEHIELIGHDVQAESREIIDAKGCVVCPGFIDIHSHSDFTLFANPKGESKVRQGVTTEIVGNCGFTAAPVNELFHGDLMQYLVNTVLLDDEQKKNWHWDTQFEFVEEACRQGTSINIGAMVGHGTLRIAAMGFAKRNLTKDELYDMKRILEKELDRGLFGMSAGLEYEPGSFADSNEITELSKVVKKYNGVYAVHLKSEGKYLIECINEALETAERTGVSLEISHLKASAPQNWGKVQDAMGIIDRAYGNGTAVHFDIYPYLAFGSGLLDLVPPWARECGVEFLIKMLRDKSYRRRIIYDMMHNISDWENPLYKVEWDRIKVSAVKSQRNQIYEGLGIGDISKTMGCTPYEAILKLLEEEQGAVKMLFFAMCEQDLTSMLKHPRAIISTDGRAVAPYGQLGRGKIHPRYYGTYPRVLGEYVRKKKVIEIEEAVKKMTFLPALKMNIKDRGLLKKGFYADIVVFDKNKIIDLATFDEPHQYPIGICNVIVNGKTVVSSGEHKGVFPGKLLLK